MTDLKKIAADLRSLRRVDCEHGEHLEIADALDALAAQEPFAWFYELNDSEGRPNEVLLGIKGADRKNVVEQARECREATAIVFPLYASPQPAPPQPAVPEEFEKALDALEEASDHVENTARYSDGAEHSLAQRNYAHARAIVESLHRAALEDAERYRWLRDSATDYANEIAPVILVKDVVTGDDMLAEEKLDEAIDAAMEQCNGN